MEKYINGGIIKSFSLFYKKEDDLVDIFRSLSERIDLELYDMKKYDNALFFDLKKDILKENFIELLYELKYKNLIIFESIDDNIKYLESNYNKDIDKLIYECDDIFVDNFTYLDINSLSNNLYDIEIEYIAFYYDGPFSGNYFNNLVNYLFNLMKCSINNPLKDTLCFGING